MVPALYLETSFITVFSTPLMKQNLSSSLEKGLASDRIYAVCDAHYVF